MLDNVFNLTPDVKFSSGPFSEQDWSLPPTNPPVLIPVIGENGELYPVEKIKVHQDGLHHLALSIFIFDGDDLLIQQRAKSKYHCAGQWANTCCTHPNMGESLLDAANRRLEEELGFSVAIQEKCIVDYSADVGDGLWEHERVTVFCADVRKEQIMVKPNPSEVEDYRWVDITDLSADVQNNPEAYTPWFRIYMSQLPTFLF